MKKFWLDVCDSYRMTWREVLMLEFCFVVTSIVSWSLPPFGMKMMLFATVYPVFLTILIRILVQKKKR